MKTTASPLLWARIAGALYLTIMVSAMFSELAVRGALIVSGNAVATAHNIVASEQLYRIGVGTDLITFVCDLALSAIFYQLFKIVSENVSLLAAVFRIAYSAIIGALGVTLFAPLILLKPNGFLGFTAQQLDSLSLLFLKLHAAGYNIALVFFGVHCVLLGILIVRSKFLPALIGILMALAGTCYVINSIINLIAPAFSLYPYILLPGLVGEGGLTLWLLIVGLNVPAWNERVRGAG